VLVQTLYTQPSSLALGAVAGICATGVSAWVSGLPQIWIGCILLTIVAIIRIALSVHLFSSRRGTSTNLLEFVYEIGAFTYALILGMIAAMTLWFDAGQEAQVMMVANALCYGVGVSARNAGRPTIAMGQLVLVSLPVIVASIALATLVSLTLLLTIVFLIPAMASISLNIFKVLRDSIAAAETSAQLADKMQTLARTDVVTGLANRAGLNHAMVETLMEVDEESNFALIWIDLDRFKEVNDLLGHPVGDRVLLEISRRLKDVCPENSTVSRFGGDEFIIFCAITDRKDAERISSEVHAEIMRTIRVDGNRLEVRASLGVALLPDDGLDADTLMQRADLALYHAKVGGRAQTCFFAPSMTRDLVRRREIEGELRTALQREELSIFFQPIVDLESGKIRTFEALVRWFHPEKGELRPDEFIPVAEESGVIVTLGNWITAQAARIAAQWPEDVTVAVNLSPLQIRAPGAALGIKNALREAGLDPRRLELEVTESLFIDDNHATASFIEELSAIGVQFALDDFGAGYTSFRNLKALDIDILKIDGSFVTGLAQSRENQLFVRTLIDLARNFGMKTVAEWVDNDHDARILKALGVDYLQGFYIGRGERKPAWVDQDVDEDVARASAV